MSQKTVLLTLFAFNVTKIHVHLRQAVIQAYLHCDMLSITFTVLDFKKMWKNILFI
jgi:hypothetical protein